MGLCFVPSALSERRWPSSAQAIPCAVTVCGPVPLRARVLTLRKAAARRSRRPRFRFSAMRGNTKAFESFRAHGRKVEAVASSVACARAAIRRAKIISIFIFA